MKHLIYILILLLGLVTVLWGCHQSTAVILPPVATAATTPTADPATKPADTDSKPAETVPAAFPSETADTVQPTLSAVADTQPTTAPVTAASTAPTTVPATSPTVTPTAAPTLEPTVALPVEPTTVPPTEPATAPATEPTTAPTTEPTTAPTTEATVEPSTEPPTVPTTEPSTAPPTEPVTVPTTEPVTEPTQHPVYDISSHEVGSLEYDLLDAVNHQRRSAGLSELKIDPTLCALAAIRAYECQESFTHTRPDGRTAESVLSDYNYNIWSWVDERIHSGSTGLGAGMIVKGWMRNDSFCADILSDAFKHIGIGIYAAGDITYIVCFFAG